MNRKVFYISLTIILLLIGGVSAGIISTISKADIEIDGSKLDAKYIEFFDGIKIGELKYDKDNKICFFELSKDGWIGTARSFYCDETFTNEQFQLGINTEFDKWKLEYIESNPIIQQEVKTPIENKGGGGLVIVK